MVKSPQKTKQPYHTSQKTYQTNPYCITPKMIQKTINTGCFFYAKGLSGEPRKPVKTPLLAPTPGQQRERLCFLGLLGGPISMRKTPGSKFRAHTTGKPQVDSAPMMT